MDPLRIGVIGLGFGEQHVRTLATMPRARLVAVADTAKLRSRRIATQYGVPGFDDAEAMIAGCELDALCVSVSPRFREPILRIAAERRLPLFIEKPWASTVLQGRAFQKIVGDLPVMVGFSFRFHPVVRRLLDLLQSDLGRPLVANGEYAFNYLPPAEHWLWDPGNGNGLFNENSCHLFDVLCAVLGDPVAIAAAGGSYAGSPSEDGAAITFTFESGAVAAVTIGGLGARAFTGYPRLDVMTERGQARLSGRSHIWEELTWARGDDVCLSHLNAAVESLAVTRYTRALDHFVSCLEAGVPPETGITEGIRAVAIAEAIYIAIRERRVVEMSEVLD